MGNQLETLLHTDQEIGDYFVLEALILSTRTADLYKAFDKSRGSHISLWVGKGTLGIKTEAVRIFLSNLATIQRIEPQISKILSFGVDSKGVPFCVFPTLDGFIITHGNIERSEAERRYMASVRIIEKLHATGIICKDLCSSSFWVQRSGEVMLVGVMGMDEQDYLEHKITANPDSMFYIAPEQASENPRSTAASDVYSLGVLGFKLFSGKFPQEFQGSPLLSEVMANPPVWGNQVFSTCLSVNPEERYSKASSIIAAIVQVRENSTLAESMPTRVNKDSGLVANPNTGLRLSKPISSKSVQTVDNEPPPVKRGNSFLIKGLVLVFAVFTVSFAAFVVLFKNKVGNKQEVKDALSIHEKALRSDEMQDGINQIADGTSGSKDKQANFQKMVMSDDPIYHDVLIKSAKEASTDEDRFLAETAILDRARRLSLRRSAEIVRPWLRSLKTGELPPAYEAVLRSLDVTLPPEAINSSLRQAYTSYNRMILKLTAGLALDTGKYKQFQGVLSQLIGDSNQVKDLGEHSLISLILYSTELVSIFGDDAVQKRDEIPNEDIEWLLNTLAKRNDINVRVIASLAMERNVLSPIRKAFLTSIRDREDLPLDILNSLVKAAIGTIEASDISKFGNWFDRASEDILLAICADTPDLNSKIAAFDILAAKSFSKEPASSLVKWIRANAWEKRGNYIQAVGILSNVQYYDDKSIDDAFNIFDPHIKDLAITAAFLDSNEERLVRAAMNRYSKNIGLGRRLLLLTHPDKEIRKKSIKSLEGINDVAGLKIILDYYGKEKDPEVRAAYSDTFWVIKEKEQKK